MFVPWKKSNAFQNIWILKSLFLIDLAHLCSNISIWSVFTVLPSFLPPSIQLFLLPFISYRLWLCTSTSQIHVHLTQRMPSPPLPLLFWPSFPDASLASEYGMSSISNLHLTHPCFHLSLHLQWMTLWALWPSASARPATCCNPAYGELYYKHFNVSCSISTLCNTGNPPS